MAIHPRIFFIPATFAVLLTVASCEGTFTQRMDKVSETIHKVDSAAVKVSKATTKLSKAVDSYTDTAAYKKDSTGVWQEKPEVKKKQERKQGGIFDSIFQ